MSSNIPAFYRFILLWVEPISSALGAYLTLAAPDTYLNSYIPRTMTVRNPMQDMIFNQLGAAFFYVATSQGILLRYTYDIGVWKIVNGCLLGWDFILLYSWWSGMQMQGRLDPATWRSEDMSALVPILFITAVRAAIVAGVGMRASKSNAKKR
ncbi:hypothetical protein BP5796_02817 [Coleophoma crateriformis]|uniref:DUF7704 domain-containing protein n=1 Tax=Coleophoma crateriformis TaxID=565419 RepID=A0A3D8SZB1_9HELO|nr:hypothetical protein BP5796_02817 [Coleophoma crateriformis]